MERAVERAILAWNVQWNVQFWRGTCSGTCIIAPRRLGVRETVAARLHLGVLKAEKKFARRREASASNRHRAVAPRATHGQMAPTAQN
jgi:hypothetical protein